LDICVGSRNPSKLKGVEKAFTKLYKDINVYGYQVEVDLPPQPFGLDTIMKCAEVRALRALEKNGMCIYGVGIEAGIFSVSNLSYDIHVACIIDRSGKISYGFSPAFRVPDRFVELIKKGMYKELEDIVSDFYGTRGIGDAGGFIGLLSRGIVFRDDLVYYAVLMALLPLVNSDVY